MKKMGNKLNFLVFELKGDYGFFKKPETTSSPISFYFPPRNTILGIIAAIMGEPKDSYHENEIYSEENCKIAVKINKRISTFFYNTNTAEFTNSLITNWAPTKYTFLKSPSYTIYIHLKNTETFLELKSRLLNKKFSYNISLGSANLFARIDNIQEIEFEQLSNNVKNNFLSITTIIPFSGGNNKDIEECRIKINNEILKTNMPRVMNNKREVLEYCTYIYERNGLPITLKSNNLETYKNKDNIIVTM